MASAVATIEVVLEGRDVIDDLRDILALAKSIRESQPWNDEALEIAVLVGRIASKVQARQRR